MCGVIVNHYEPFEGTGDGSLEDATSDLVDQIQRGHPHLREERGRGGRPKVEAGHGLSVVLQGRSPTTGDEERVHVLTRALPDGHVLYALFVVPREEAPRFEPAFARMAESLRVDDRLVHR
jgi:hypothetical protein